MSADFTSNTNALLSANCNFDCSEYKSGALVDRLGFAKLVTGACLTVLLAATVFGPLGFGLWYADQLEHRVRTTLDDRQMAQIDVAIVRNPALRRAVLLSGQVDRQRQLAALEAVKAVPGVEYVSWVQGNGASNGARRGFLVRY